METAVIILNYNGKKVLNDCLKTVLQSAYKDFQIILVDNASKDGSIESAERKFSREIAHGRIKVIKNSKNTGFAEGNNIGYKAVSAKTQYVVLLNYDTVVPEDWLGTLVATMRYHPEFGICGSIMDEKTGDALRKSVKRIKLCASTLAFETGTAVNRENRGVVDGVIASGNGMAIRRARFKTLFNPDYFAYHEDTDICLNAKLRGMKVGISREACFTHYESVAKKGSKGLSKIAVFNGTKNQIVNYLVHYRWKNIIRILPLFAMTQLAQVAYQPTRIIVKLKAYFWVFTNLGRIRSYREEIQRSRKVDDAAIIKDMSGIIHNEERFSPGIGRSALHALNKASLLYCRIVCLRTMELQGNSR